MEKYLQLDGTGKIISVQGQQNAQGTLLLKEITEDQLKDIFMYSVVGGSLQFSLVEYKQRKLQEYSNRVSGNICLVKKIKKFEDIINIFDLKKNQTYTTKEQIDTAMNEIILDLFY